MKQNLPIESRRALRVAMYALGLCAMAGSVQAATLDLSDCDVLIGTQSAQAYKKWISDNEHRANAGEHQAIRSRAADAVRRLTCHEEKLTGRSSSRVTITMSGGAAGAEKEGPSVTTRSAGIPNIELQPVALKALNDAVRYTHQAGVFDPGYKSLSAQTVVRYAAALPERIDEAYADAAGAYAYDCVLKLPYGMRVTDAGCATDRTARAELTPRVTPERRAAADAAAQKWAEKLHNPEGR
ncbi:hypothetical protein ACO0LF_20035 [Undibacterium sp. Di27W]|uniref:hypothetical protein n=1 Tax=Undibacterium sp. Di27W TaxID=3413036 RepID=UPI003BF39A06